MTLPEPAAHPPRRPRRGGLFGKPGSLFCGALLLGSFGCAQTQPDVPGYGPETRFSGTLIAGFEIASFNGCWFSITPEASADFDRLVPAADPPQDRSPAQFHLEIIGRRTLGENMPPEGYGHLGMWSCQIEASRILVARRMPPGE
ncbi:MAG TPA: hypothetical protein VF603_02450 [Allosphingosinicella sp.]|jgi:hypothetical protein